MDYSHIRPHHCILSCTAGSVAGSDRCLASRGVLLFNNIVLRFKRPAYGLRTAPRSWQDDFAQIFVEVDIIGCKSDATACVHESFHVIVLACVDDLRVFGKSEHPRHIKATPSHLFD